MKTSIFIHIYFPDVWRSIIDKVIKLNIEKNIFINVCQSVYSDKIINEIKLILPEAIIISSPNNGKDIGGKLLLIDLYLKLGYNSEYLIFLHDKKSPQAINGDEWRDILLKIIDEKNKDKILKLMLDEEVGMLGSKEFLVKNNKDLLFASGESILKGIIKSYKLLNTDYTFIGGSMFWVKENIFRDFFTKHSAYSIYKSLESGNVLDEFESSYTHSWERVFAFLVSNQDKRIIGI